MNQWANMPAFVVLAILLSVTRVVGAPNELEDVGKVVNGFAAAWNRHDMEAFGKLFALDADFVNVAGAIMKGRHDIQIHHAWAHGAVSEATQIPGTHVANYGIFKNSTMKFDAVDVRVLAKDVAIAHVKWQLFGDARSSTPRQGIFIFVLTRGTEGWQIAAAQNTEINRTVK